ncbi:hypothetical protein [Mangrovibacterium marinum]|uniref:HEAT repeat protein n=1 Tax=Mangrovibacterium marinum TaxID=1639118 RepID=A0A2T5BYR4_9BACT|nr:hypothetical protein [Mangrovibacterium marinum]PTN07373.1 hypothetical protein C8N47_11826 [Mangrovibacterium marinum]
MPKFSLSFETKIMTSEEIQQLIIEWGDVRYLPDYFHRHPEEMHKLVEIVFSESHSSNWRAAWLLDKINEKDPIQVHEFIPPIIDFAYSTENGSKLRHLLKIISLHEIPREQAGKLFDYAFSVFTNPNYAIAIRVHAMQILFEISEMEYELKPELISLIENELEIHPSPGIKSRGTKLLRKLCKQTNR